MKSFKTIIDGLKRGPVDCVGIDFGTATTKLVRLRNAGTDVQLVAAEILPPSAGDLVIPPRVRAHYAGITTSRGHAITKLLTFPGAIDSAFQARLRKSLGLNDEDDSRISYRLITEGQGRVESRALAVSLDHATADPLLQHFSSGIPVPQSLEIASLSALTAFEYGPVANAHGQAIGLIDFGTTKTTLSFFYRGSLVLMRQFDFGTRSLFERVETALHVDTQTAQGILADSAFDVSELLGDIMNPVINQFVVSRDFIERRENCSDIKLLATGGVALSKAAMQEIEQALSVDIAVWNPLEGLTIAPQALAPEIEDQHWRLGAAIGAALAVLEAS